MFKFIRRLFVSSSPLSQAAARSRALVDQRAWLIKHQDEVKERLRRQRHVMQLAADMRSDECESRSEYDAYRDMSRGLSRGDRVSGFTLIELMIVVAIIGLLSALAIPAYQSYTARAQVAEGPSLAATYETAIADYYNQNGVMPASAVAAGMSANGTVGKYSSVQMNGLGGAIQIKYNTAADSSVIGGAAAEKDLYLEPYLSVSDGVTLIWVCGNETVPATTVATQPGSWGTAANATTEPDAYLPGNCRTNAP